MISTNKNGSVYQRMVNRRLATEGKDATFKAQERKWGTRIDNTPFIEHNGAIYLEVFFIRSGATQFTLDGAQISKSDIIGMPKSTVSEESQGGLEDQVIIRTIKCDNIRSITCDHKTYTF